MELIHGGDAEGFLRRHGRPPLDFSANVNPLGVPEGVQRAIAAAAHTVDRYPDPLCRELTGALAQAEQLPEKFILCGSGAADLIYRLVLARRPKCALLPVPTFAEYENALRTVGCQTRFHPLLPENGFRLDDSLLPELTPEVEMLFLCNPNNPTGQVMEPGLLRRILERCRRNRTTVLLDECFQAFLPPELQHSCVQWLDEFPNAAVLKAFTKLYGMAGVRLGYLLSADCALLERCFLAGPPWAVSSLAQAAGIAALQETEYLKKTQALICRERRWMKEQLRQSGIEPIGSHANYLFFASPLSDLSGRMEQNGILIRSCDNYFGLPAGYCRVAVRTRDENEILVGVMQRLLKEEAPWQKQL
ncbi:MAG: pyridoxal phosphate-dependent aminotransferase [Oscillospiraceae bacterium]|jgi:threonine-phosphate decarboxylase